MNFVLNTSWLDTAQQNLGKAKCRTAAHKLKSSPQQTLMSPVWITPTYRSSCSLVHAARVRFCWTRRLVCCCSTSLSPSNSNRRSSNSCWILHGLSGGSFMLSSHDSSDRDPGCSSPRLSTLIITLMKQFRFELSR